MALSHAVLSLVQADLDAAMRNCVLSGDLQKCFLCIPVHLDLEMWEEHWKRLRAITEDMAAVGNGDDQCVMKSIGLNMGYIQSRSRGGKGKAGDQQERLCRRFYAACILRDLVQETEVQECMTRYAITSSKVADLREDAARFAMKGKAFCDRMSWIELGAMLEVFAKRVVRGVKAEILALTNIAGVKQDTARQLHRARMERPEDVANADVKDIAKALADKRRPDKMTAEQWKGMCMERARKIQEKAKLLVLAQQAGMDADAAAAMVAAAGAAAPSPQKKRRQNVAGAAAQTNNRQPERAGSDRAAPAPSADDDRADEWEAFDAVAGAARPAPLAGSGGKGKEPAHTEPPPLPPPPQQPAQPPANSNQPRPQQSPPTTQGLRLILDLPSLSALLDRLKSCPMLAIEFVQAQAPQVDEDLDAMGRQKMPSPPKKGKRKQAALDPDLDDVPAEASEAPVVVLGMALSWAPGCAAYIPLHTSVSGARSFFVAGAAARLAALLFPPQTSSTPASPQVITFGFKYQVQAARWLRASAAQGSATNPGADLSPFPNVVDARIATWMVHPDAAFTAEGILDPRNARSPLYPKAERGPAQTPHQVLSKCTGSEEAADGAVRQIRAVRGAADRRAVTACCNASAALALASVVLPKIEKLDMSGSLMRTEMALVPVLADMELNGVGLDMRHLERLNKRLLRRVEEVQTLANRVAGTEIELTRPRSIGDVLFGKLGLAPPPGSELQAGKSGKTNFSTGKAVLAALASAHPVVPLIQEHRQLSDTAKTVAIYLGEGRKLAKRGCTEVAGVVRLQGSITQTNTATGRLSTEEPNLQCMPKTYSFLSVAPSQTADQSPLKLTPGGRHAQLQANTRAAVVPTRPGRVILSADFCQVELRIMAHFSGDPELCAMVADGATDPFRQIAAGWRRIPSSAVTNDQRNRVKQITYALLYGLGDAALGASLGINTKKAAKLKDDFLQKFSGIAAWLEQVREGCRTSGRITTLHGRHRWLPHINHEDSSERSRAERAAVNSVCQGSAADIAKAAMVAIHRRLGVDAAAEGLPPGCAHLVLQIHDEFLLEVDEDKVEKVARVVKSSMEVAGEGLSVPLRVKLHVGPSWGELSELHVGNE